MLWRWHLSLNIMNQPLLGSKFSSEASSPLTVFKERGSTLVWIRVGLGQYCGWFDLLSTSLKLYLSAIRLFPFLITHMFTEVALLISFKFLCIYNLASCLAQEV